MPTPNLGYGNQTEASADAVNIWIRGQPWYQAQLRAWGQDPGHPTLTKSQSQQILRQAQAQGVVVDEGDMEVDDHGNFNPVGHKLRNTLIVGGLAAATIATMGAAGAFSGAAGAGSGAAAGGAGAAGTGGTLASTAIGSGYLPAIAGAVPTGMAGGLATGAGTFGAGMGAAATTGGIINSAKSIVDTVNKAKGLVTGLTGSGGSSNGTPSGTPTIADLAAIVAAIGKGRADGRVTEADVNQNQARAEADIFRTRMEAALKGPSMEARSAAIGDTLANVKPFAWTGGTSMVGNIPVPLSNGGGLTLDNQPTRGSITPRLMSEKTPIYRTAQHEGLRVGPSGADSSLPHQPSLALALRRELRLASQPSPASAPQRAARRWTNGPFREPVLYNCP